MKFLFQHLSTLPIFFVSCFMIIIIVDTIFVSTYILTYSPFYIGILWIKILYSWCKIISNWSNSTFLSLCKSYNGEECIFFRLYKHMIKVFPTFVARMNLKRKTMWTDQQPVDTYEVNHSKPSTAIVGLLLPLFLQLTFLLKKKGEE